MVAESSRFRPTQTRIAWHCTCFNARRTSRTVTQYYDELMAPTGIKATQFTMLGAIALMGPASVTRLARHLGLDRTTLTRNLRVLVETGLVVISEGNDRRERVVGLTANGQGAVERATPVWLEAQHSLAARFGDERLRRLIEDMSELSSMIEGIEDAVG